MKNKAAYLGIFAALALILGYIEALFPFFLGIPGVKLGLANSMSLVLLSLVGAPAAVCIAVIRVVLTGFLFGNLFSIAYGLAGGLLSIGVMILAQRSRRFSTVGVSVAGGISHNVGQLVIAIFLAENRNLVYYAPVLLLSGLITGMVIGLIACEVLKRLPKMWR